MSIWQKRRRPTAGGQLDDKRREMLKRHPLSLGIDLKCKGNSFSVLHVLVGKIILCIHTASFNPNICSPFVLQPLVLCNCTPIRWHVKQSNCGCDMTPLDPCVPSAGDIWNTVTDYREICIAGVTLPKGGWSEEVRGRPRDGGEKDACSLVVLQHLQHLVSSFSHHCSLSDFCFYFWSPSFPQLSSLLPAAAFGPVQ